MARIDEVLEGRESWAAYALDVAGHAGLGAVYALVAVAPILYLTEWGVPVALGVGLGLAVLGGLIREVVQSLSAERNHWFDRALDVVHHALGAPIAVALILIAKETLH